MSEVIPKIIIANFSIELIIFVIVVILISIIGYKMRYTEEEPNIENPIVVPTVPSNRNDIPINLAP